MGEGEGYVMTLNHDARTLALTVSAIRGVTWSTLREGAITDVRGAATESSPSESMETVPTPSEYAHIDDMQRSSNSGSTLERITEDRIAAFTDARDCEESRVTRPTADTGLNTSFYSAGMSPATGSPGVLTDFFGK